MSMTTTPRNIETNFLDSDIDRNRLGRFYVLIIYLTLTLFGSYFLGDFFSSLFFATSTVAKNICWVFISVPLAALALGLVEKLFIIRNETNTVIVTVNHLASLFKSYGEYVYTAYGPGLHLSYPTEKREAGNNISLNEATNEFNTEIQLEDGILRVFASMRLRPDPRNPIAFLSGVAIVADDIKDLMIAEIVEELTGKKVTEAIVMMKDLNSKLQKKYIGQQDDTEKRFSVYIGDVTITKMLPSEELQRSISAISEAEAIQKGTLIILGLADSKELQVRLDDRKLSQADVNLARDRFLSISGNLDGMEIKRTEFDLSVHGLEPEAIASLLELAKQPGLQALIGKTKAKK